MSKIQTLQKTALSFTTLGFLLLFSTTLLFAQNSIKIKVVDTNEELIPNVTVLGPNKQQFKIATGTSTIDLGGPKSKLASTIDRLQFVKNGWQTVGVEYFERENEILVTLEPSSSKSGAQKKSERETTDTESIHSTVDDKSVTVKIVLENGTTVSNLKMDDQIKQFVTSKNGNASIPAGRLPYLNIKGYKILRTKQPSKELVIVVAQDTGKQNLAESIESVVNQVRTEQLQLEETNTLIVLEINNILKRLSSEKALSTQEKKKLKNYLKRLTDEINDGDRQYEENKGKRDELLEKLNFLLLEKDSINKINQMKILTLQKEKEAEKEASTRRIVIISIIAALLSAIVLLLFFLMRKVSKQKGILQIKNGVISQQKESVQTMYKELSDNITSAKLIQNAILPGKDLIKKTLPSISIFYQPRNIVSGDFYWFYQKGNTTMIAAVDCTGHGVAGAFMSFLGYEILNIIARENKEIQAGDILSQLNVKLIETLNIYGANEVNAGMDISLCVIDFAKSSLEYAGANNPLYVVRKGTTELEQYAGDRQGIGGRQKTDHFLFRTHTIPFNRGDHFMIFSDGYAGQIGGGTLNQKFMYNKFRQLFTDITPLSPEAREQMLEKQFLDWKGEYEQLDDVLVICFTV